MEKFNYYDFLSIKDNQILKIKLKGNEDRVLVKKVSQSVVQPWQPTTSPIKTINLEVIKNLELYKSKDEEDDNYVENIQEITIDPIEIEEFELVEI